MGLVLLLKQVGAKRLDLHVATDEEIDLIHDKLLNMLKYVYDICEDNHIGWSLCGGSLIGAVRHKGFIPWDDDVDILMTRLNFEKFQNAIKNDKQFMAEYELKLPGDRGYIHPIARLCTKEKYYVPIMSNGQEEGIPIDIFVIENTYDNKFLWLLHGIRCKMYMCIGAAARANACKEMLLKYGKLNKRLYIEIKFWLLLAKFFSFHTVNEWWGKADKCFSEVKNENSKFVMSPRGSKQYFGEQYDRKILTEYEDACFEDTKLKIIKNPKYLLTRLYGPDFMSPPSRDKIEQHVFVKLNTNKLRSEKKR
ncbi:LPS biosynthesis protein [Lachnospiraceae bacterium JC7]|nr:LPS biosynthesis protein [Lachnospiraceae bacterium JC7]